MRLFVTSLVAVLAVLLFATLSFAQFGCPECGGAADVQSYGSSGSVASYGCSGSTSVQSYGSAGSSVLRATPVRSVLSKLRSNRTSARAKRRCGSSLGTISSRTTTTTTTSAYSVKPYLSTSYLGTQSIGVRQDATHWTVGGSGNVTYHLIHEHGIPRSQVMLMAIEQRYRLHDSIHNSGS